ncbi:kinase-like protein, partial [Pseudovirgaria hyperparasitica]
MPRGRPRNLTPTLSSSLLTVLLLSSLSTFAATAPQQQPQDGIPFVGQHHIVDTVSPDQHTHAGRIPYQQKRNLPVAAQNERAVATLPSAPAVSLAAVHRAPSSSTAAGGIITRPDSARNLQDWEVEDFVLLATVDGQIHARDRETGQERWSLYVGRPMVETTYSKNKSSDPDVESQEMPFIWIVEPSQDGNIYVYTPQANSMQKLDVTVQMLAEMSPWSTSDPPMVYTAEKRTTLYTIDARSGNVLRRFSSGGSTTYNTTKCDRTTGFEPSNKECVGSLTLGQIEYTVSIQNRDTGEDICTINFFEWSHNKKDNDLYDQYLSTMDNKYVYSKYDGTIFALDHTQHRKIYPQRPVYTRKLDSPVVRVFDVARPYHDDSPDPPLLLLPQPHSNVENEGKDIWVNCTEAGSWYAMSEFNYPAVTDGASEAKCYHPEQPFLSWSEDTKSFSSRKSLVGVHSLANELEKIEYPDVPFIEAGPSKETQRPTEPEMSRDILGKVHVSPEKSDSCGPTFQEQPITVDPCISEDVDESKPRVHFADEANRSMESGNSHQVTVVKTVSSSHEDSDDIQQGSTHAPKNSNSEDSAHENDERKPNGDDADPDATPKKKKAHRGQRGGRKRRKPTKSGIDDIAAEQDDIAKIIEQAKNVELESGLHPDEITINGRSSVTDISGPIQLGKLTIYTDRILGNGSGGTFVFEGKWKERDVAIKRMLPQYFGLAEQEVSLLQQSDLHPNVIRYFDDERDQNFLYIAVELCQASLWDLYREAGSGEPLTDEQHALVTQINSDVPTVLKQLAAGLAHLHSLRIIHRDIKPQNILIAYPHKGHKGGPRLVISDFGLCKTLPDNVSTLIGTTNNAGTIGWKAPELILQPKENERNSASAAHSRDSTSSTDLVSGVKRAVDIFSLGCVFYYVLTNGSHPFDDEEGWAQVRELNIKKNKFNFSRLDYLGSDVEEPIDLLHWMLSPHPEMRPTAWQVMQHPFFWSAEKRLNFLCDVSDHWEREPRDPPSVHLTRLENMNLEVIMDRSRKGGFPDFLARLDRKFVDTLGKQRKYTGDRLLDLLRAFRNKKNHYEDMPADVKAKVGPLPHGYLAYWNSRFPKLLMACYKVVMECDLQEQPRFLPYF